MLAGDLCSSRAPVGEDGASRRKFCQLRPGRGKACNCDESEDCEFGEAAALTIAVS